VSETYPESKRSPAVVFGSAAAVVARVGDELGLSEWHAMEQERIDLFARATGDFQWIHVDPVRAGSGPFGATIAHGFLTLSLLPMLMAEVVDFDNVSMTINYGLNKVRFPAPVRSGSQVRARVSVLSVEPVGPAAQIVLAVTIESDFDAKPVCVAEPVIRAVFA
jgi:acyl dehydratase